MASTLIISCGKMLIDFVPYVAGVSLAESDRFVKAPGGNPANVAITIAKLGRKSAFIGKFDDDEFGHMLADILKNNGVVDKGVLFEPPPPARTAFAFVTLRSNGEREFMIYRNPSADMLLTESELNLNLIRQAKIFHYGSISLISEPCRSAHMAAMPLQKRLVSSCHMSPMLGFPCDHLSKLPEMALKAFGKRPTLSSLVTMKWLF